MRVGAAATFSFLTRGRVPVFFCASLRPIPALYRSMASDSVGSSPPCIRIAGSFRPSGNPRFHQQMVYAVAMRTLENFDRALGRQRMRPS